MVNSYWILDVVALALGLVLIIVVVLVILVVLVIILLLLNNNNNNNFAGRPSDATTFHWNISGVCTFNMI